MEPTQEQIEAAAKAMFEFGPRSKRWESVGALERAGLHKMARAAAPFLQMPWKEVTAEESETIHRGTGHLSVALVIKRFVELRNAALLPKPVDPRESIIVHAMCNDLTSLDGVAEAHRIAKRIIVAMDTAL